jgi:hypothetical protein
VTDELLPRVLTVIDLEHEKLISLHEVPKLLPQRTNGKRLHISAVYRWAQRGVHGLKLEVIRIGGTTYTSVEALQRFSLPVARPDTTPHPTPCKRQQHIDNAIKSLDEVLRSSKP